jgi:cell shape-determining protein MreC
MVAYLRTPGRSGLFSLAMVLALLMAHAPVTWTAWMRYPVQVLSWMQQLITGASRQVSGVGAPRPGAQLTPQQAAELHQSNEELRRQLAHLDLELRQLEEQLEQVTGLRDQLGTARAKIRIAAVVGFDAAPGRQVLTISEGSHTVTGLRPGLWVAAGATRSSGDEALGRELLARQWLVGRIVEVQPLTSRVQLVTDPGFGRVRVQAASVRPDGRLDVRPEQALLVGGGLAGMTIERAPLDYMATGARIVLLPASPDLPAPLTIGEIVGSRRVPEAAMFFDINVRPFMDLRSVRVVYVILPGG